MKKSSCTFWTVGAIATGAIALGMAGMAMTTQKSSHGFDICGCHIDPAKDMRRMADNVHDVMSDMSRKCRRMH